MCIETACHVRASHVAVLQHVHRQWNIAVDACVAAHSMQWLQHPFHMLGNQRLHSMMVAGAALNIPLKIKSRTLTPCTRQG